MGVKGAAVATVAGQIFSMCLALVLNAKYNPDIKIRAKGFRPNGRIVREIYAVGVPSIFMQSIASVMTVGINKILILFSETAVAVFGVYFKLQSFVFMPVFGLNNALVPIVGYNYGARNHHRITQAVKLALIYALIIMGLGVFIFLFFPDKLLEMFDASPDMLEIGVPALRIICISFLGAAVGITFSSVFQAIGHGVLSLIMSVCRQLLLILPVAYILGSLYGLNAVWYAFAIAEVGSVIMAIFMYRHIHNKVIAPLSKTE